MRNITELDILRPELADERFPETYKQGENVEKFRRTNSESSCMERRDDWLQTRVVQSKME